MPFTRLILSAFAFALSASFCLADTVVERWHACVDRGLAVEIGRLLAANDAAGAARQFESGVRARSCRILELGEIVAALTGGEVLRIYSFTGRDRLWTTRQALARCAAAPDWLPARKHSLLGWLLGKWPTQDDRTGAVTAASCASGAHKTGGRRDSLSVDDEATPPLLEHPSELEASVRGHLSVAAAPQTFAEEHYVPDEPSRKPPPKRDASRRAEDVPSRIRDHWQSPKRRNAR